ncbi:expressed unknown protein [Seminavis robusta]|uniref:Transmembrane protein n=1 Tax=Seminavis robusta TaxID=568900 RepID=A0A9N8DZ32_9STRA|nr:expressed unknown protein [Seminavis robusta]|eukprot:Sro488_g153050.1 n/a (356) ;mRNA; r:21820-22887
MGRCCGRCSPLDLLSIFLAKKIPWCHAVATFQRSNPFLIPTRSSFASIGVLLLATDDDDDNGGPPTIRNGSGHSLSEAMNWHHQDSGELTNARLEFFRNEIQSPPTILTASAAASNPSAAATSKGTAEEEAPNTPMFTSSCHPVSPQQQSQECTNTVILTPPPVPQATALDRAGFRLDGFEVYAVVSALTLATSIQFFDLLSRQWTWDSTSWMLDLISITASAMGMMTGLHATFIFSLMTVYGRTAVGMGRDVTPFLDATQEVRARGFRSFHISLYTFGVQIVFVIVSRLPPTLWRRLGAPLMALIMWKVVYGDTKILMAKAGVVLFEEENSNTEEVHKNEETYTTDTSYTLARQ